MGDRERRLMEMREVRYAEMQKRIRALERRVPDTSDIPEADEAFFKKAKLVKLKPKKKKK